MSEPMKAFIIAMTFGDQPHQQTVVDAIIARDNVSAVAITVSRAHATRGVTSVLDGICIAELTDEFITAAHRGTAEPAPVLSIVAQQLGGEPPSQQSLADNLTQHPLPDGAA